MHTSAVVNWLARVDWKQGGFTSGLGKGGKVVDSLPEMFRYAKGHGEDDGEMHAACTVGDGGRGER